MNYPPPGQHMAQTFRPQGPKRRQSDYHYIQPAFHAPPNQSHQFQYQAYPYVSQYHVAPQSPYQPHWYQPYHQYSHPALRPFHAPSPMLPSPHNQAQTSQPLSHPPISSPQPTMTPLPELSTPSTTSQVITSPSTTPTTASVSTSTPPVPTPKAISSAPATSPHTSSSELRPLQPSRRLPYYPPLPWFSVPDAEFPPRNRRRRKKRQAQIHSDEVELPQRPSTKTQSHDSKLNGASIVTNLVGPEASAVQEDHASKEYAPMFEATATKSVNTEADSGLAPATQLSDLHRRPNTKPVFPAVPIFPVSKPKIQRSPEEHTTDPYSASHVQAIRTDDALSTNPPLSKITTGFPQEEAAPPIKDQPKSWARLFARDSRTSVPSVAQQANPISVLNGPSPPMAGSLGEILNSFTVNSGKRLCFLEPRGLVNTGNMCYMNSILQVLLFCVPFYEFLDEAGTRAIHSFKNNTPLIESLIMFMREYPVIDSAVSMEQLRLRLKGKELEQYGEPFIPEYVYDVIKKLPRFSSMRRGHQQDAEEFLGFLLEGLHDECVLVIKGSSPRGSYSQVSSLNGSGTMDVMEPVDSGWLEVGPKQKSAFTKSSGTVATESPITKIFGGQLRSVFRVPGLKDSVTLEPYQPLQLDIGASNVHNITDALKGLTRSETLHGDFSSPRGPGTTATKQVFIETLPPVLILHLKRFQYDNTGGTQKIWRRIGYPLDLEIPKEVFPQHQRGLLATRHGGLPKYRLISVVYHHGKSASGGHYTVDVRRQEGEEWIRIDDTSIRRIRAEDVAAEGSEEDPKLLLKALEHHSLSKLGSRSSNIYKAINDDEGTGEEDGRGGWSQVNGSSSTPTGPPNTGRKWSNLANGTAAAPEVTNISGRQTPKASSSNKDNKVAYILFYQHVLA